MNESDDQLDLADAAEAPEPPGEDAGDTRSTDAQGRLPAATGATAAGFDFVNYAAPDHEKWRVERGSDLIRDFELEGPESLTVWHAAMGAGGTPATTGEERELMWSLLRRVYGIAPFLGVEDPDDIRAWPIEELASSRGMSARQIENHLAGARMYWKRVRAESRKSEVGNRKSESKSEKSEPDDDEVERLLLEQGFGDIQDAAERRYIASRIKDFGPWLESEHLRGTARSAIQQEAAIFYVLDPSIRELRVKIGEKKGLAHSTEKENSQLLSLIKARREEQQALESTLSTLGMTEASGGGLKKKLVLNDWLSALFDAVRAANADGDRALVDGFFEAAEIELLITPTTLRPAQYRPDLIVSLLEAKEHLWEKEWSPTPISRRVCRTLKKAWDAALAAARADEGEVPKADSSEEDEKVIEAPSPTAPAATAGLVAAHEFTKAIKPIMARARKEEAAPMVAM